MVLYRDTVDILIKGYDWSKEYYLVENNCIFSNEVSLAVPGLLKSLFCREWTTLETPG